MGARRIELDIGSVWGKWVVVQLVPVEYGPTMYLCRCSCGTESLIIASVLRRGDTRGCIKCRSIGSHGDSKSSEYRIYRSMLSRCRPNDRQSKDYYERGITVCDEWVGPGGYERFLDHIGRRPSKKHTLDRIDNNKGYSPGNVRWAIRRLQQRNTRSNRILEIDGVSKCLIEWSEMSGVDHRTILARLNSGWPEKDAVFREPNHGVPLGVENQSSKIIEIDGESASVKEWSEKSPVSASTIMRRLRLGWSAKDAVFSKDRRGEHLRGKNRMLTIDGKTLSLTEWSELSGLKYGTISARLSNGWPEKKAVFHPLSRGKKA